MCAHMVRSRVYAKIVMVHAYVFIKSNGLTAMSVAGPRFVSVEREGLTARNAPNDAPTASFSGIAQNASP